MKKIATGFIFLCFLFFSSVCSAAFLIHLKDGREISTHKYWEEGDQIKIHQYGGVVGIAKEEVVSIEETDEQKKIVVKPDAEVKEKDPNKKAEGALQSEGNEEVKEKSVGVKQEKKPEGAGKEKPQEEKNSILKEFDALKKRFEKVEDMTKEDIFQFDKDLSQLRNKILKAGLGAPYANQMVEISEMGNKAEEMYKKKSQ
jgi:hypothetical protein